MIIHYSSKELTEAQYCLLGKGPNFIISSRKPNEIRTKAEVENFRREVEFHCNNTRTIANENLFQNLEHETLDYIEKYGKKNHLNISKEEFYAYKELLKDKSRVIVKADKVNSFVILDKYHYNEKGEEFLNSSKFEKLEDNDSK